ncbi:unnamed protein product [Menidia menidia]|uniref:(Atlantic silverside) hypothetical protein n=1 Tax=Menidia menidia TaxID=238744 RepID=A0A8S4AHU0_9TELE|nr:unnamed protein product [Menidia menidia]
MFEARGIPFVLLDVACLVLGPADSIRTGLLIGLLVPRHQERDPDWSDGVRWSHTIRNPLLMASSGPTPYGEGGLPLAAFNLGKVRPYQRGFFCSDDSIRYPFHHSTVTSTVLYTVGFSLPIGCVRGLPLAAFNLGKVRPYQRGFFCSDDSIRYPFHHSTVTSTVLYTVGFSLPIGCMIFGECLLVYLQRLKSKSPFGSYVACLYKAVGTFLFGAAMSQSLTDIAKYSIGRLRPHFLDVCRPDWKSISCSSGGYIENYTCTGDPTMVNEGRWALWEAQGSKVMCVCGTLNGGRLAFPCDRSSDRA